MEDRTVATLTRKGKDAAARIEWESTLILGYVVILDKGGYELLQLKEQLDGLSSSFDYRRPRELISAFARTNRWEGAHC